MTRPRIAQALRFSALVCLAILLVAFGAAVKHSQYEQPGQGLHHLRSVKMEDHHTPPAVADLTGASASPAIELPVSPLAVFVTPILAAAGDRALSLPLRV